MSTQAALFIIGGVLIGVSIGTQIKRPAKPDPQKVISEKILDYGDSINAEKGRLLMLLNDMDASTPSARKVRYAQLGNERAAINKRIYAYQFKIDSLRMYLKK